MDVSVWDELIDYERGFSGSLYAQKYAYSRITKRVLVHVQVRQISPSKRFLPIAQSPSLQVIRNVPVVASLYFSYCMKYSGKLLIYFAGLSTVYVTEVAGVFSHVFLVLTFRIPRLII